MDFNSHAQAISTSLPIEQMEKSMMKNDEITWILNEECIQVCIGLYQVILAFTNNLTITVECEYLLESEEKSLELHADNPENSVKLIYLLGRTILQAFQNTNSIHIIFSGGVSMKLLLEDDGLESLSITKEGMQINR